MKKTTLVIMTAGMGIRFGGLKQAQSKRAGYRNTDKRHGISYREDLQEIKEAMGGYIHDELYANL